jgi:pimeloyl-ACP methyl ester carboxylesterase
LTRRRWALLGVYALVLAASTVVRRVRRTEELPPAGIRAIKVGAVAHDRVTARPIRLAFLDSAPPGVISPPVLVLLHGSPGDHHEVGRLAAALAGEYRVLCPDLPGFGGSTHGVPDYSIRAHAHYVLQLLDSLRIPRAHVLGFSMGGGVALELADLGPGRVASITMLSAIGAQEFELLGDYHLNHLVHGLQLAGLWLLYNAVPHFGAFDGGDLSLEYARNFYDTDQRPLRGILERYQAPMLIVQGKEDPLVPAAIAAEHHRLVPQSELVMLEGNHFMAFQRAPELAKPIGAFLARVEAGKAVTRATASPERIAAAEEPFDPAAAPPANGIAFVVLLLMLAVAVALAPDLTAITAGLLVARGTVGFAPAALACMAGLLAQALRRLVVRGFGGRPRSASIPAPLRWHVSRVALAKTPHWIVLLAAIAWVPLLAGLAVGYARMLLSLMGRVRLWPFPGLFAAGLALRLAVELLLPLLSWRGRRLALSRWRRLTRWEFWPPWAFYPPVVLYVLWLGLRHRSLTLFTAANPGIPGGGFVGESKWQILQALHAPNGAVPATILLPAGEPEAERAARVRSFVTSQSLEWPLVLKPDVGERGDGVAIVGSDEAVRRYLQRARGDVLAQEYLPGREFGIFYYRLPGEPAGRIFAITDKRLPTVMGDGRATLETLILEDDRAVCIVPFLFAKHAARLGEVPATGEVVPLVELGTHCRGAMFFDGTALRTAALEAAVDRISKGFEGFHFGRYDVRAESVEALQAGRFRVIELNGVTSEATSIYDPAHGLLEAYRTLRAQWRLVFEIGGRSRAAGARPARLGELVTLALSHRAAKREHASGPSQ